MWGRMDSYGVLRGNLTQIRDFCVDVTYLFGALRMHDHNETERWHVPIPCCNSSGRIGRVIDTLNGIRHVEQIPRNKLSI